jgi:hypothetical protein
MTEILCYEMAATENTNVCFSAQYSRFMVIYCCLHQPLQKYQMATNCANKYNITGYRSMAKIVPMAGF